MTAGVSLPLSAGGSLQITRPPFGADAVSAMEAYTRVRKERGDSDIQENEVGLALVLCFRDCRGTCL